MGVLGGLSAKSLARLCWPARPARSQLPSLWRKGLLRFLQCCEEHTSAQADPQHPGLPALHMKPCQRPQHHAQHSA